MKIVHRKWTTLALIVALLVTMLPPMTAFAAGARISITNLDVISNATSNQPFDLNAVPRYTSSPISVTATIQNITDVQIPDIYYEVTNVSTNVTISDKNNRAQKTGPFDINFNNVPLTEGLNMVTLKMGGSNAVSSAVGWVYFTPTTNIGNLNVNNVPFIDTQMYPDNPATSSNVNISGTAPNATNVQAYVLGDPAPKSAFLNGGTFFFTGDDVNKLNNTANFKLNPGDNQLTLLASNSSKTYQIQKNLLYDNGSSFAFNATVAPTLTPLVTQKLITTPTVTTPNVTVAANIKSDLTPLGDPKYRYVNVLIGGQTYGPYDLTGASPGTSVTAIYPNIINQGYSDTTISVVGTGLAGVKVTVTDINGANALATPDLGAASLNSTSTVALYTLPAGRLTTTGPYTFTAMNGANVLYSTSIQAVAQTTMPAVDMAATTINGLNEGYVAPAKAVTFTSSLAGLTANLMSVDITDITGQSILATANGIVKGVSTISYTLPAGLVQGTYKFKISYSNNELSEGNFIIGPPNPVMPTVVSPIVPVNVPRIAQPTYLVVNGTNLGIDPADITVAGVYNTVGAGGALVTGLTVYDVQGTNVVLKLADPSVLVATTTYDIKFTKAIKYPNGTPFVPPTLVVTSAGAIKSVAVVGAQYVTDISPVLTQVFQPTMQTTNITINGAFNAGATPGDPTLMLVEILKDDGVTLTGSTATVSAGTPVNTQMIAALPSMPAGNYILRISYNSNVLAQYPLAVASPALNAISPSVRSVTAVTPTVITATGTNFGRIPGSLKLRFVSDANPLAPYVDQVGQTVMGSSTATFNVPTLIEGTYSVTLLYNNVATGVSTKYTVSSPPATLKENLALSRTNRYKVYDFSANLTIPSVRYQIAQFQFFNFPTDNVPPTSFAFNYIDPNLPYIDHIDRVIGTGAVLMSELNTNQINELPTTMNIYSDLKTNKVNVYLGTYDNNAVPAQTLTTYTVSPSGLFRIFAVTLNGLANGPTKLTVVPSTNAAILPTVKVGESTSGKKAYDLTISSTPYVIVNNLYNGIVVKDPNSEISCMIGSTLTGSCFTGRLVNVPQVEFVNVEVYVNGNKNKLLLSDFDILANGTFHYHFDATRGGPLVEGKNTIQLFIYNAGVLVTQASFDIFQFSTSAPDFASIKPIETTDVTKFIPSSMADTYTTAETAVSFAGQFVNATEIKLTVKQTDSKGVLVTKYDRRYTNFTLQDPLINNPGYFLTANSPAGQFLTNPINLAAKGNTTFEFAITNSSNITITRTITITRDPQSFVVVYPVLTKNASNEMQATLNSNFIEIEMAAENADNVLFGKDSAVKRLVTDSTGNQQTHYFYEVKNLKAGKNIIKFSIVTGTTIKAASIVLFNADIPVEGALFKSPMASKIKAFNGNLELDFPKDTSFIRNEPDAVNQFLTADRKILFGIASKIDGRVDKYKHPAASDAQLGNPNPLIDPAAKLLLNEPTGRFKSASKLFWIDGGTIAKNETDQLKALSGSGQLPYDTTNFYSRTLKDLVVPTKRGTLILKYDANIRSDAWRYLTVYQYDIFEDYKGITQPRWRNIGGVVDTTNHTITVPLERFGYYEVMYMDQSFDDVTNHPWARDSLDTLYSKGIMLNKSDTTFIPNDPISRGEFATLLVKIFEIPLSYTETPTFTDVLRNNPLTNGLYDYKYIETAASAGIIRGSGGGHFSPDSSLTRQDAAVMIAKAANLKLSSDSAKSRTAMQKTFTDANGIDPYALTSVEAVSKAGLITGKPDTLTAGQKKATFSFAPTDTFTRAEAATVAISVLRQQKKIPK